jgi:hypothetical protein
VKQRIADINAGPGGPDLKARLVAAQQGAFDETQTRIDEASRLMAQIAARLSAR